VGNRAAVDITKGQLSEDEFMAVAQAMTQLVQTPGWQYLTQLIAGSKHAIMQMIHEPGVTKDYLSGMLRAIDTIPDNVAYIVEHGAALTKAREEEKEAAVHNASLLPFVKPGGSTPAN